MEMLHLLHLSLLVDGYDDDDDLLPRQKALKSLLSFRSSSTFVRSHEERWWRNAINYNKYFANIKTETTIVTTPHQMGASMKLSVVFRHPARRWQWGDKNIYWKSDWGNDEEMGSERRLTELLPERLASQAVVHKFWRIRDERTVGCATYWTKRQIRWHMGPGWPYIINHVHCLAIFCLPALPSHFLPLLHWLLPGNFGDWEGLGDVLVDGLLYIIWFVTCQCRYWQKLMKFSSFKAYLLIGHTDLTNNFGNFGISCTVNSHMTIFCYWQISLLFNFPFSAFSFSRGIIFLHQPWTTFYNCFPILIKYNLKPIRSHSVRLKTWY